MVEEIAQETFVRAYKNLKSYDPERGASFSTWLFVIGKNLAINEATKASNKNEIATEDGMATETYENAEISTPETILRAKQTQKIVHSALGQVPPDFRRAVVLSHLAEHSLEEIAEIENCSVGTIKSRIFRGKEILRKILSDQVEVL